MGETNLVYPCKWNCSRNRTNIYHPQINRKKNSSIWIEICHQQLQSILITEQMEYFSSFSQHVPLSLMIATRITHTNHDAVQINCVYSSLWYKIFHLQTKIAVYHVVKSKTAKVTANTYAHTTTLDFVDNILAIHTWCVGKSQIYLSFGNNCCYKKLCVHILITEESIEIKYAFERTNESLLVCINYHMQIHQHSQSTTVSFIRLFWMEFIQLVELSCVECVDDRQEYILHNAQINNVSELHSICQNVYPRQFVWWIGLGIVLILI